MQLTFNIPDQLVTALREAYGENLSKAVLEHFLLSGYQAGKISRYQVQTILGFDNRWDTENWLGERGAHARYGIEDLHADRDTFDRLIRSTVDPKPDRQNP
jgi:hypothetical protein